MTEVVVTVTHTIVDGAVVRWYAPPQRPCDQHVEMCSASRNGVQVHYKIDGWQDVINTAGAVHDLLRRDRDADLSHLATHRRRGLLGDFVPLKRGISSDLARG